MDININKTGRNEHLAEIECQICTSKEHIRATANQLLLEAYPHRLTIEMVYNVTFWLNFFPHRDGVDDTMIIDYNKHCKLEFGTYVQIQIHEEHDNSLTSGTTGAIALRPTGNTQGSHCIQNFNSG